MPAKDGRATLETPCTDLSPSSSSCSPRTGRAERTRLERGGRASVELRSSAARPLRRRRGDAAVHARRGLVARGRDRSSSARGPSAAAGAHGARAAPEVEDGPDAGSQERRRRGWRLGNPWWAGASDRIEARAIGQTSRAFARSSSGARRRTCPLRVPAATVAPAIVPRSAWGANESIRRGPPVVCVRRRSSRSSTTRRASNEYTRAQAAAIVRGIQLFHVKSNGWNDIGYNFLVDRFGTIYEGRYGGVDRNVSERTRSASTPARWGSRLLGTYGSTKPSAAAQDAIARLIAWRLDLAHVDPTSTLTFISGGSERYAPDAPVTLRAVSGHRDTGSTECPGNALYARLGAIAASARALGGTKIFEPKATASGTAIRFRARVSQSQPWTVAVTTAAGAEVAGGSGTGSAVDWTWDSAGVPPGSYRWTIAAGAARPATGILRAGGTQRRSRDRERRRTARGDQPERRRPGRRCDGDVSHDGGRQRHGRGDRCARRSRGDRGRPRVDAGR